MLGLWWMSSAKNPASDVIIVIEREPDVPGGGHHRPLRKRARTTGAMESEQNTHHLSIHT
ncbi:hypothetical protein BKA56DRAFT_602520 [Ilyonectria sp. MPI-CAGE-AT-0026]|nr:hypothetical protein BKA56DRAFT_602520 [Ilyonectria sp. MPI-CAGE-AT-0026]